MRTLKIILLTGFGLGYIPVAPATFACMISIAIWRFFSDFPLLYLLIFLNLFVWGLLFSDEFSKEWGKDPRCIVVDEYACFLLPLYFIPKKILFLAIAFLAFRILDVLKPPPLRSFEKLSGGLGIMLDDLGAGIYTAIAVIILVKIIK